MQVLEASYVVVPLPFAWGKVRIMMLPRVTEYLTGREGWKSRSTVKFKHS